MSSGPSLASFHIDYDGLNQAGDNLVLNGLNPTATTLNVSAGPYTYGNAIDFTANVATNGNPAPDGATVELFDNNTMIGTPQTISSGSATFDIPKLNAGQYDDFYVDLPGRQYFRAQPVDFAVVDCSQRAITVTAAADTKTYDGTTSSTGVPIITGALATGDTADFSQVFDSRNAGSQTLTASGIVDDGNGGANYSYTFVTAAGTINQLAITVTAATDTKTYDGTTTPPAFPRSPPAAWRPATRTDFTQVFDSRNAGSRTLDPQRTRQRRQRRQQLRYTFVTAAGTINQLAITVTAATDTKTYDGTTTSAGTPTITAGSLATGDTTTNFTAGLRQPQRGITNSDRQRIVNDGNGGATTATPS